MTEVRYNVVGYPSYVRTSDNGYVQNKYTAGDYAALDVHTHPKGDLSSFGEAKPSDIDKAGALKTAETANAVLGYIPESSPSTSNTIGQKEHSPATFGSTTRTVLLENRLSFQHTNT